MTQEGRLFDTILRARRFIFVPAVSHLAPHGALCGDTVRKAQGAHEEQRARTVPFILPYTPFVSVSAPLQFSSRFFRLYP